MRSQASLRHISAKGFAEAFRSQRGLLRQIFSASDGHRDGHRVGGSDEKAALFQEAPSRSIKFSYFEADIRPASISINESAGEGASPPGAEMDYKIVYDSKHRVRSLLNPTSPRSKASAPAIRFQYDSDDRLIEILDGKGSLLRATFAADGRPLKVQIRKAATVSDVHQWSVILDAIKMARQQSELFRAEA